MKVLLAAWLLIGTGNWAFVIAIAVHAFNEDGSGAVAVLIAARLLPAMIAAPFIGHLVDRFQRDRVAASFCVAAASGMCIAGALVLADAPLWAVGLAVALTGATVSAPRPALQTLIPALARTPQELTRATAAWSALDNLGFMLGSGLGGIAVGAFDPGPVLLAASALIALAGLLSVTLPSTQATALDEGSGPGDDTVWAGLLGGIRALRDVPDLRVPAALLGGLLILEGSSDVQLVALALGELDMGDAGPGLLYAVWGLGGLAGSAVVLALLRRRGYGLAMGAGVITLGLALAVAGADGVVLALAAMVPAGLGFALVEVAAMGLVPRLADDAVAGRVYGLFELLYAGGGAVGALIAPLLIALVGVRGSMAVVGLAYAAAGGLAWGYLRQLDRGQEDAGRVRDLLRAVPFLSPLPLPRLERLVQQARHESFATGETIIARGDPAEDFFVIEDGTVEIVEYGRTQHAGEGFGEIALLKTIPRTATVRATTDVSVCVLGGAAFRAAVAGHSDASTVAEEVVDEHLSRPMAAG